MASTLPTITRRHFVKQATCLSTLALLLQRTRGDSVSDSTLAEGIIHSSGETLPAIGLGTYITFNVGNSKSLREDRSKVLQSFFDLGGGLLDSSPMYGSSEEVIGYCLKQAKNSKGLFSATKIWTSSSAEGKEQMEASQNLWGEEVFDLQQVHNLVNWQDHLAYLHRLKEAKRIRYLGVTTSHGRRHRELASIMRNEPLDFVQLTYNILDREAEETLLPLAQERGIAVIANRPYQGGRLMDRYKGKPLPSWKDEVGVTTWADLFLKFIISHPGITVAIPATSKVDHLEENMGAMRGPLPDESGRARIADYVAGL